MDSQWKIIIIGALGICAIGAVGHLYFVGPTLPSDAKAKALAEATMRDFSYAVLQKNFEGLYARSSVRWKKQTTPQSIAAAFVTFIPFREEIREVVITHDPILTVQPFIESEKVLTVEGYYPFEDTQLGFRLQYVYEGLAWKLFGMHIAVQ